MNLSVVSFLSTKPRRTLIRPGRNPRSAFFASSAVATTASTTATMTVPDSVSAPVSKPVSDVLAGATARAASQATVHPLDTLKVRMQTAAKDSVKSVRGIGKPLPSMHRTVKTISSLYKGVLSAAAGAGVGIGTYFVFYSTVKNLLMRKTKMGPGAVAFVSGGAAAAGASVIKVPLAVCIRSVQAGVYKNAFSAAASIIKAVGLRGVYTGYFPTLIEDVPDMAVKFAAYETMRSVHQSVITDRQPNAQEDFAMGAISGALAAACTTPIDVVKTNMMCQAAQRPTMSLVAKNIMRSQGPKGFFHGVGARALSNGMNSAVFFCIFEAIRTIMVKRSSTITQQAHHETKTSPPMMKTDAMSTETNHS